MDNQSIVTIYLILLLLTLLVLVGWILIYLRRVKLGDESNRAVGKKRDDCLRVPPRYWKKPDPYVYSQLYLSSLGLEVTWDNPDFRIERGGVEVVGAVTGGLDYEVVVTVHNGSTECPAFHVTAAFSLHDFGAGDVVSYLGARDIPVVQVQGMGPSEVRLPWRAPARGGHFCLVVKLDCAEDSNRGNNEGQHNLTIVTVPQAALGHPGAGRPTLLFPITNRFDHELTLHLAASSYSLPPRRFKVYRPAPPGEGEPAHDDARPPASDAVTDVELRTQAIKTRERRIALNRAGGFPLPPGWIAAIPSKLALAPGERREISVPLDLPAGLPTGTYNVTFKAMTPEGFLYGGVTTRVVVE